MHEQDARITHVRLYASHDIGHGGATYDYSIEADAEDTEGYKVTLTVSRLSPAPGERSFQPSRVTEVLRKDQPQVEAFLRRLSDEFQVFELTDLKSPYPFLHPTFYSFSFGDSAGRTHSFNYQIEAVHLDARYQALVAAFHSFFESEQH